MSYITGFFERLDLQHIRELLFKGVECVDISNETFKRRLEAAGKPVFEMLDEKFPNMEERDQVESDIHHYASVSEEVYMEIGMKCGAVLAMQLLQPPK